MIHRFVLHNGKVREAGELSLSPGQVGLLSGWGVFSTLRVADGVLFAFDRHWARMKRDATALHVPLPQDAAAVQKQLHELIEANQASNCTLR
ncbi:MAG TPA: aminotransferase class IV, partial [Bryobacteraceae bacterium]|nr:aminotransferase class IV [Bryobacteraceae bacterium]